MNKAMANKLINEIFCNIPEFFEGNPDKWDWEKRCPLVNPLCPDDLCILPLNHVGGEVGYHYLTTSGEAMKVSDVMYCGPAGSSRAQLIGLGYEKAEELFPEDVR